MNDDFSELEREVFAYAEKSHGLNAQRNGILFFSIEKEVFHLVEDMKVSVHRAWEFFHGMGRFPGTEASFRWNLNKARKRKAQTSEIVGRQEVESESPRSIKASATTSTATGKGTSPDKGESVSPPKTSTRLKAGFTPSAPLKDYSIRE